MTSETRDQAAATALGPVVKELTVPLPQAAAFALFTERIGRWWPLASHSVAKDQALDCAFEPHVGGRLYELARDGTQHTWGTVLAWEPPTRVALTWHPGRTPASEQHLEVTFAARGTRTIVRLVHTGWERMGDRAAAERDAYEPGWDFVLSRFVTQAGAG